MSFAKIPEERASMPFVNATATLFLVSNNSSTYMIHIFMLSMVLKWPRTALSNQKMFTMGKKQRWTVVGFILIDYHTMKMNTFVAMDESLLQMNASNLLSIRKEYWSNVWSPIQLIPGFKKSFSSDDWSIHWPKIILFWISVLISDHA